MKVSGQGMANTIGKIIARFEKLKEEISFYGESEEDYDNLLENLAYLQGILEGCE